ncbi:hypothetical protein ONE63_008189 [Megalurothrips usitatus]|uniref:Uncharacterized protein n=1 Tax=Megalurothrips usitatus TaxID=439358 RepID=A0AAV7XPI4_9NEOP|nr:hypothetical protein ONE63_008189 [Megalurothrips usitatus]
MRDRAEWWWADPAAAPYAAPCLSWRPPADGRLVALVDATIAIKGAGQFVSDTLANLRRFHGLAVPAKEVQHKQLIPYWVSCRIDLLSTQMLLRSEYAEALTPYPWSVHSALVVVPSGMARPRPPLSRLLDALPVSMWAAIFCSQGAWDGLGRTKAYSHLSTLEGRSVKAKRVMTALRSRQLAMTLALRLSKQGAVWQTHLLTLAPLLAQAPPGTLAVRRRRLLFALWLLACIVLAAAFQIVPKTMKKMKERRGLFFASAFNVCSVHPRGVLLCVLTVPDPVAEIDSVDALARSNLTLLVRTDLFQVEWTERKVTFEPATPLPTLINQVAVYRNAATLIDEDMLHLLGEHVEAKAQKACTYGLRFRLVDMRCLVL